MRLRGHILQGGGYTPSHAFKKLFLIGGIYALCAKGGHKPPQEKTPHGGEMSTARQC